MFVFFEFGDMIVDLFCRLTQLYYGFMWVLIMDSCCVVFFLRAVS